MVTKTKQDGELMMKKQISQRKYNAIKSGSWDFLGQYHRTYDKMINKFGHILASLTIVDGIEMLRLHREKNIDSFELEYSEAKLLSE